MREKRLLMDKPSVIIRNKSKVTINEAAYGTLCTIPQESKSEAHTWVQNGDEIPAQVGKAGKINYTCEICAAEKSEEIPAVNAIPQAAVTVPAPSNGGKAAVATIAAEDCDVTLTEWFEGGNDVYIDDDFAQDKTYTIEVTLVALGNNTFTDSTAFTVNGMAAKVIYKTANSVTLSYTFTPVEQHKHTAAAEWSRDTSHHWKACSFAGCGAVIEETRAAHDFAWIVDQAATETAAGKKHEEWVSSSPLSRRPPQPPLHRRKTAGNAAAARSSAENSAPNVDRRSPSRCRQVHGNAHAALPQRANSVPNAAHKSPQMPTAGPAHAAL